jgi:hypothetical protein
VNTALLDLDVPSPGLARSKPGTCSFRAQDLLIPCLGTAHYTPGTCSFRTRDLLVPRPRPVLYVYIDLEGLK